MARKKSNKTWIQEEAQKLENVLLSQEALEAQRQAIVDTKDQNRKVTDELITSLKESKEGENQVIKTSKGHVVIITDADLGLEIRYLGEDGKSRGSY